MGRMDFTNGEIDFTVGRMDFTHGEMEFTNGRKRFPVGGWRSEGSAALIRQQSMGGERGVNR